MNHQEWRTTPWEQIEPPTAGNVQVYRIQLDGPARVVENLRVLLTTTEQNRANRFLREVHTNRFTIAHAALRGLLGKLMSASPESIVFAYGSHDKPEIDSEHHETTIKFNMSHTADLAVIGVTQNRPLGIDIEQHKDSRELEKLARRYFSPREVTALFSLPEEKWSDAFYRGWCSKEAVMKITGLGLSLGLDTFDVELDPECPPALLAAPASIQGIENLHWSEFQAAPDMTGILTVADSLDAVELFELNPEELRP